MLKIASVLELFGSAVVVVVGAVVVGGVVAGGVVVGSVVVVVAGNPLSLKICCNSRADFFAILGLSGCVKFTQ